jgi:L-asparaginase / beta-aspartyl-peptidase
VTASVVVIHAGAGDRGVGVPDGDAAGHGAFVEALEHARACLERGGDAIDAAHGAVASMESFELFNAGRGSVLCSDGTVEMSAALMRGSDRAAGAVAGMRRTRHPITGARLLLTSPSVLLAGDRADAYAEQLGVEQLANAYFVTDRQRTRLAEHTAGAEGGTVGAVCLDGTGMLAAATSTGGVRGQPPGRVGDSPLIGAGTWADGRVAVSCTGDGEAFIRSGTARYIATLMERGLALEHAAQRALDDVSGLGGRGGLIGLDSQGAVVMPFLTEVMPRGIWRPGQEPAAWTGRPGPA